MNFRASMMILAAICVISGLCKFCCRSQAALNPTVISTRFPTSDHVIASVVVTDSPFNAVADGSSDATTAIQKAIDTVSAAGGGVVFLPAGRYRMDGDLTLREGVTLRGDWKSPTQAPIGAVGGTILMPTADRGNADGAPFIAMSRGTGVRDLTIWYPNQSATAVEPYPWTIASDPNNSGDNYTIEQVTMVNPYQGFRFGPEYNEMFTLREVYGCPLHVGLTADSVTDIGRMIDVHFDPKYWSQSGLPSSGSDSSILADIYPDAIGVDMLRSDWQYIYDVSLRGYAIGFRFRPGLHGSPLAVLYDARAVDGKVGLMTDDLYEGLELTNCTLTGVDAGVVGSKSFVEDLQFIGCHIGGRGGAAVSMQGIGSLRFENCTLDSVPGRAAVAADAGNLTFVNCKFEQPGTQLRLAAAVKRALVVGCKFNGLASSAIANNCHGDVQVSDAPVSSPEMTDPVPPMPPEPAPKSNAIFEVIQYGAQSASTTDPNQDFEKIYPTLKDQTQAFQSALDAAGKAGGGTVYVPAGYYLISGNLSVPSGVELRGCFDVPHHTISLGSVLLATAGRGDANATPFIKLQPGSGARGLTIWYPDQMTNNVVPYPWTFQSLGPKCWLMDVSVANPYQLADFGTYPSDGHLLRYVAGAPLHTGIWVSKGSGIVDSCHFNSHEWERRVNQAPPLSLNGQPTASVGDYEMKNLDAFVFGDCPHEIQVNNFVYGDANGLKLAATNGPGCGGWIINHGSDGSSVGLRIDGASANGCDIVNTEIATVGDYKETSLKIDPTFKGKVSIYGCISFGETDVPAMKLNGAGQTLIEGWLSPQMPPVISQGAVTLENTLIPQPALSSIVIGQPGPTLTLIANSAGPDAYTFDQKWVALARNNAKAFPGIALNDRFKWPDSSNPTQPNIPQQGVSNVNNAVCQVNPNAGPHGEDTILIQGDPVPNTHPTAYMTVFTPPLVIQADTIFRYWIKPQTPGSLTTGMDIECTDGSDIRDSGLLDTYGRSMHPGSGRGIVGGWTRVECQIGQKLAGKTIARIVFAYDCGNNPSTYKSEVTDIEIGEPTQ